MIRRAMLAVAYAPVPPGRATSASQVKGQEPDEVYSFVLQLRGLEGVTTPAPENVAVTKSSGVYGGSPWRRPIPTQAVAPVKKKNEVYPLNYNKELECPIKGYIVP
jgi:hypothetical protein